MTTINRIVKDTFYQLGQPSITPVLTPDLPASTHFGCGCDFTLKVLADDSGDPLKNDRSGFLWWFGDDINAAQLTLQKWSGSAWIDVATLVDDTYGTNYAFEFFTNSSGENFIGYQIEWALVLAAEGEGSYRVICDTTDYLAATNTLYSYEFCLKTYRPDLANGTVKIEFINNSILGDTEDDKKVKNLVGLNWYNAFRLRGWFGFPEFEYEETNVEYNNGQILDVTSEQEPVYELLLKMQPFFIHEAMRTDVMQSDETLITDYNSLNPKNYVQKSVRKSSAYKPVWNKLQNKLADCTTQWKQRYNNNKKFHF